MIPECFTNLLQLFFLEKKNKNKMIFGKFGKLESFIFDILNIKHFDSKDFKSYFNFSFFKYLNKILKPKAKYFIWPNIKISLSFPMDQTLRKNTCVNFFSWFYFLELTSNWKNQAINVCNWLLLLCTSHSFAWGLDFECPMKSAMFSVHAFSSLSEDWLSNILKTVRWNMNIWPPVTSKRFQTMDVKAQSRHKNVWCKLLHTVADFM